MNDQDAEDLSDKALATMVTALKLAGVPLPDLSWPTGRTVLHRAEVEELSRDHLARQGQMDRYLDSRDQADDDAPKEWVLPPAPETTLYTFAQPNGAPATGDKNDCS